MLTGIKFVQNIHKDILHLIIFITHHIHYYVKYLMTRKASVTLIIPDFAEGDSPTEAFYLWHKLIFFPLEI